MVYMILVLQNESHFGFVIIIRRPKLLFFEILFVHYLDKKSAYILYLTERFRYQ